MIVQVRVKAAAAALVLVSVACMCAWAKETRPTMDEIITRWSDGPVRYLMTFREEEAVRSLKSVPELARFISDFWARRDPSPGTIENEFRRIYWGRVLEADRLYRDSTTPGWKTDRGRIFILLGAPDDIQTDENPMPSMSARNSGSGGAGRGLERWTYHRHGSRLSAPEFIVAFVRDGSLDWRLSTDSSLIQPSFPGTSTMDPGDTHFGGGGRLPAIRPATAGQATSRLTSQQGTSSGLTPSYSSLFANYDLGLEISVPTTSEEVIATVTAREFLSAFSATPLFEFFRAEDGSTFVDIGALVKAGELYPPGTRERSSLRLYASVTPAGEGGLASYASNDAQPRIVEVEKGPPAGGYYDVWTGLALRAGRYHMTLAVEDTLTGRIGRTAAEVEVPDLGRPGLALSTLVLASDLSEAHGRLGVTARPSATYRRAETLGIYYEVYGLPGGAKARFTTSYRFYRGETQGAPPAPVGKTVVLEDRTEAAQGWSFPLAKWPPGRYRIEVTVTGADNVSVSSQIPFEVIE